MRLDLGEPLADPSLLPDATTTRLVSPDDAEALAVLMDDAYRGTIDAEPGQDLDDARKEIAATFAGDYGAPLLEASVVAVDGDKIVSASIVTRFEGSPFVAFTMTRSSHKGRGLSRAVMTRSVGILARAGESHVDLIVTAGNDPAQRLYSSLGFVTVETYEP
jgi:ribosomal protein S18 acetylase RimI-like enzyme